MFCCVACATEHFSPIFESFIPQASQASGRCASVCFFIKRGILRAIRSVSTWPRRPCSFLLGYKVQFQRDIGMSESNRTNFHELVAASPENFNVDFYSSGYSNRQHGRDARAPLAFVSFTLSLHFKFCDVFGEGSDPLGDSKKISPLLQEGLLPD